MNTTLKPALLSAGEEEFFDTIRKTIANYCLISFADAEKLLHKNELEQHELFCLGANDRDYGGVVLRRMPALHAQQSALIFLRNIAKHPLTQQAKDKAAEQTWLAEKRDVAATASRLMNRGEKKFCCEYARGNGFDFAESFTAQDYRKWQYLFDALIQKGGSHE